MKTFKTAKGFLKHLAFLATEQDMSDCTDWDKLSEDEQKAFYGVIAGIQNDLGEIQRLSESSEYLKGIY
ncbi:MAG TPA: hypothetical protein VN922_16660 [Bacteroidia bacterium]|nr:hypothetical protein [Bacteroidia bacterium]